MNIVAKIGAGLGLLATAFVAGWLSRTPAVRVETKTKTVEVEKVVTKTVVQVVKAPDGTTTTTTTKESTKDATTTVKDKVKDTPVSPVAVGAVRRDWSVGVQWRPRPDDFGWQPAGASIGYRVTGPVWAEAGVDWKSGAAIVGVRVEF